MHADVIPIRYVIEVRVKTKCKDPDCKSEGCFDTSYSYTSPDGTPVTLQAGDVFLLPDHRELYQCTWENCDGKHLVCMVPDVADGCYPWCIDGRASNCTMPEDHSHRCWVRRGDLANGDLHVSKEGFTCAAGAGSIQLGTYHGHLHNAHLRKIP